MHAGDEQVEAGWYPDPHEPSRLRYWDGAEWTNHFHDNDGRLPDIGTWLANSFRAIAAWPIPAIVLSLGLNLVLAFFTVAGLSWAIGDLAVVDGELVGADRSLAVRAGLVFGALVVVSLLVYLVLPAFFHRAHLRREPTIASALRRSIVRTPRLVGVGLVVLIIMVLIAIIVVVTLAAVPALGVLLVLAGVPLGVWLVVKLWFLPIAVVAAPRDVSALTASARVSDGRFWAVFARLLLLMLMVAIVSSVATTTLDTLASPIDATVLDDVMVIDGETVSIDDFEFSDLFASGPRMFASIIVSSIINAAASLVTISALTRLYVDAGAPSELW